MLPADTLSTRDSWSAVLTRLLRTLLPAWLLRMLRPSPISVDGSRIGAAALGVGLPPAVGMATANLGEAVLVSLGGLCITFSDPIGSYHYRLRRVGLTVLLGGFGFAAGLLAPSLWTGALVVVGVSVLSVLSSRLGDLWGAAGAQMLTFCIVATGTPLENTPAGEQIAWFLGGELLTFGLIATTWPFRRTTPARRAVARVFESTARMLEAPCEGTRTEQRRVLTRALNEAHDILITVTAGATARSRIHDRLYMALTHATPVVETSVALAHRATPVPASLLENMRGLATCLRTGSLPPPHTPATGRTHSATLRALDQELAELTDSLRSAKLAEPTRLDTTRGRRARFRIWREGLAIGRTGWLLAIRMALCLTVAEAVGLALPLEQPYWVALTVALVLKPNSGSLFARTMLRGIGSVLGVALAVLLLAGPAHGWGMLPFTLLLAALVPDTLSRNYGLFTGVVTCLVLLKMNQVESIPDLPTVRLVDSLLGCGIVLVVCLVLSPLFRRAPLERGIAACLNTVAEYVSRSLSGVTRDRSALRRRSYRELAELRATLRQRLVEPAPASRTAERWWPSIVVLERLVDEATARAVHLERGGGETNPQHTQLLVSGLRSLARQLRSEETTESCLSPERTAERLTELEAGINEAPELSPSAGNRGVELVGR